MLQWDVPVVVQLVLSQKVVQMIFTVRHLCINAVTIYQVLLILVDNVQTILTLFHSLALLLAEPL